MLSKGRTMLGRLGHWAFVAACAGMLPQATNAQPAWGAEQFFQYNIENVVVKPAGAGTWNVKVIFSVTNPVTHETWDIKHQVPFQTTGASLTLDIGWDPGTDLTNTGSENALLALVSSTALGGGAALPVQVRNLQTTGAAPCDSADDCPNVPSLVNRFRVARDVTPVAFVKPVLYGRVAIEGKPVCNGLNGFSCPPGVVVVSPGPPPVTSTTYANIPVRSEVASFRFEATENRQAIVADPRRKIVDIAKCKGCHDGNKHGDTVVPRLSLHGNNRNENLTLCVVCHNPNQTDVPYRYLTTGTAADPRIGGAEVPVDFKVMVHSIHSGGFRTRPYVVIGRNSSVNDFSGVRFPAQLRDCTKCHIDLNGKGTFELPLDPSVLGTTVNTRSIYLVAPGALRSISVNPADDVKVSPTAAACSACHDNSEVKSHMVRSGGASFATTQAAIGTTVKERCANCHGPGKEEDVRRAHEIGGGSSGSGGGGDASVIGEAGGGSVPSRHDGGINAGSTGSSGRHGRRGGD